LINSIRPLREIEPDSRHLLNEHIAEDLTGDPEFYWVKPAKGSERVATLKYVGKEGQEYDDKQRHAEHPQDSLL
jgi:hypothetical protein